MSGGREDDFFDSFCLAPNSDAATEFLNKAVKLVMVAGQKLRVAKAGNSCLSVAGQTEKKEGMTSQRPGVLQVITGEIELVVGEHRRLDRLQVAVAAG
ncbi:hypothetical protein C5167_006728 [Papaver somniferum]|uniref:Uncharacterized protein n=1 Tax=Papaver somniferum TaxID=3469 RepID=A0A4Y7JF38_PAPSO|nr:hypothetical protein C5167_006728 [Papaver somniferum]